MKVALTGAMIFDGKILHQDAALLINKEHVTVIIKSPKIPHDYEVKHLEYGIIIPGFVDLQVNGGGGVMFNDSPDLKSIKRMLQAHQKNGTAALLPTLITDKREKIRAAIDAVDTAIKQGVRGIIGLHLEGPHLSVSRKGAHDPDLIRPMDAEDEQLLLDAALRLPNLLITIAPENVLYEQITRLQRAGIIVSLGHSNCSYDEAIAAFAAGASCVTHLFNAMSQIGNREPGLVGAALDSANVSAGLIADGIHVHKANMRAAIAAKKGPGQVFLVTDAMATAGSEINSFMLNNRKVSRRNGKLTLEDGTLAGADLSLLQAIHLLTTKCDLDLPKALMMATSIPASLLRQSFGYGRIEPGTHLDSIRLLQDQHCVALLPSLKELAGSP